MEYSEKILDAASDSREGYQKKMNAAEKTINDCKNVYTALEAAILSLEIKDQEKSFIIREQQKACQQEEDSFHGQNCFVMVRTPAERGSTWRTTALSCAAGEACRSATACFSAMLFAAVKEPGA